MKRARILLRTLFMLVFLFIFIQLASAVEFSMNSNFSKGETLTAKLSGNFLKPPTEENIFFYRGHTRVPIDVNLAEIDGDYYLYFQLLGKEPGNYTLSIENVKYLQEGAVREDNLEKQFTIIENVADFLVKQGFIVSEGDFFIEVQNLKDSEITLHTGITNQTETEINTTTESKGFFESLFGGGAKTSVSESKEILINLKAGEIKKINFLESQFNSQLNIMELSSGTTNYKIPIMINLEPLSEKGELSFENAELVVSFATNSATSRRVYIKNTGTKAIENISFSVSKALTKYILVSPPRLEELGENSTREIILFINSSIYEKNLTGQLTAKSSEDNAYLALYLNFIKDFVPIPGNSEETPLFETCSQLGGIKCPAGEACSSQTQNAVDGECCFANCKKQEKSSSGKIIGIIVLIVIVAGFVWFYFRKYKKSKKPVDVLKVATEGKK